MSEFDVYRRQILTSYIGPHTVLVKVNHVYSRFQTFYFFSKAENLKKKLPL